jgi:hypothetical protein
MAKISDLVKKKKIRAANAKLKKPSKPFSKGTIHGLVASVQALPPAGTIKRYILTAAQNNTPVHAGTWKNILALAKHYDAEIFVGTFTYDQNSYGVMSVKKDTFKGGEREPWYAAEVKPFFKDSRIQLGAGLVWCGEANIMPTARDPLAGSEVYEGRQSIIFPHAKIAMRSIASTGGSGAKLVYTTGTVTKRNYIQKRAGMMAEFHHTYGGLIVEVNSTGVWRVRQLDAEDATGTIHDLTLKVENGVVTDGHSVEAIVWGDIHATRIDQKVLSLAAVAPGNMLDVLKPKYQFIHDLIEGASVNHHDAHKPLERFRVSLRGLTVVQHELQASADVLQKYARPSTQMVVVNSNHDRWLDRWLDNYNPQIDDARNAEIYHDGNAARYRAVREGGNLNVLEYLLQRHTDFAAPARFLQMDESFLICNKRLECGQHGDLGANGSAGSPKQLSKVGRRAITAHTHTAGIYDGLYVAGTSTEFRWGYNHGPSSWTHSHVVVYPNGKRTIITMFDDAWKA